MNKIYKNGIINNNGILNTMNQKKKCKKNQ